MNVRPRFQWREGSRTLWVVNAVFALLVVSLLGLMAVYWFYSLQPRLAREATSQAEILARSQSNAIAHALRAGEGAPRLAAVTSTLDELLVLRDPATGRAFFESVSLQVDYEAVAAEPGSLDITRGTPAEAGFTTEVAVYDPKTQELLALARFQTGDEFYRAIALDLRRGLSTVALGGSLLILALWTTLIIVLRKLQRERETFQEELHGAMLQAEAASRAKSIFLANMSHEIRTPLNGILGLTDLALKGELTPVARDKLVKVSRSARHLTELVEDLLDLARIEAGRLELHAAEFDVEPLLDEIDDIINVRAETKGLDVRVSIAADVPKRLIGDATRLKQVLLNLLGNAVKFTDRGRIELSVGVSERGGRNTILRFTVRDSGIGIPADFLPKLFDAFTQVDDTATRRFGGAGLGLAISRRIVEKMGGRFDVSSEVGRGSTFTFTADFGMPSAEPAREAVVSPAAAVPPGQRFARRRVLLVEDNDINREVAGEMLRLQGVEVETAAGGEEALDRLARERFDLVFLDIQMPGMDGLTAVGKIRENPELRALPVVAMTAHAMAGDRERFLEAGMSDYVSKPISEKTLTDVLARWLSGAAKTAVPAATAAIAAVDAEEGLRRVGGNADLYLRLLLRLRDENQTAAGDVRGQIDRGDVPGALARLHTLRGAAAMLSVRAVAEACAQLEQKLRAAPGEPVSLEALETALAALAADPALAGGDAPVAAAVMEQKTQAPPMPEGMRNKVLIVEDQATNSRILAEALGSTYELLFATTGARALELAPKADLILLDVVLPDLNGFEVCRRLHAEPQTKHIPVIFVTAREDDAEEERGFDMGGVDYITKPIRPSVVRARVRTHLELKEARDMLERMASVDPLTALANRRQFDETLLREIQRSQRTGQPVSLAIIDVDHFKAFNDTYGHTRGDVCLHSVAQVLKNAARRPADVAARYGGEEFALVLPDTAGPGLEAIIQGLLMGVRSLGIAHAKSSCAPHVTVSVGAVSLVPGPGLEPREIIERADKLLYEAKQGGRNRCVLRDEARETPVVLSGEEGS